MLSKYCIILATIFVADSAGAVSGDRIAGGQDTRIVDFPHQASLMYYEAHYCSAAIISENWAITAGYCIADVLEEVRDWLTLRIGADHRLLGGVIHELDKFIVHENYVEESNTIDYDIALIKSRWPFEFNARVQPILLPESNEIIPAGTQLHVSGWGMLSDGLFPFILQNAVVPAVDNGVCSQQLQLDVQITERVLCAGSEQAGVCTGDGGAPLVRGHVLYGIASRTQDCALYNATIGIYARIPVLRGWISEHTAL